MIFQNLQFFFSEAFIGMRRSGLMTLISMVTVTVSLIVFGLFLLMTLNLNNFASLLSSKLEIRLFLKPNLTKQEIISFQTKVSQLNGVRKVEFVDKKEAWDGFKSSFSHLKLNDTVNQNPLPDSIRVQLKEKLSVIPVAKYLERYDYYIENVVYGGKIAERIERFSTFTKLSGIMLVSLLGFSTLLIIVNTIRLTVLARQEEISIMQLVGATDRFIRVPFLIEGLIIGLVGSGSAILLLNSGYGFGVEKIQQSLPFFPIVMNFDRLIGIHITVGIVGAFIGLLGAYISVSKTLKNHL